MSISKENYIPGFDWFRIVGSVLVVAAHQQFFVYFYNHINTIYNVLSAGVPVFFIISGYLCGRDYSKKSILKQALRYGIPYLLIEFGMEIYYFSKLSLITGENHFLGFMANIMRCFIIDNNEMGLTGAMWFILALVYALLLNAIMTPGTRKIVIVAVILFQAVLVFLGETTVTLWFEQLLDSLPLLGYIIHAEEVHSVLNHFLTGVLFTTVGLDLRNWKIKPIVFLFAGFFIGFFEVTVCYLNLAVVFLSVALFYGVKRIPGQFLRPYHLEISTFSVSMYFLHMAEKRVFFLCGLDDAVIGFLFIIFTNLLITLVVSKVIRKRCAYKLGECI